MLSKLSSMFRMLMVIVGEALNSVPDIQLLYHPWVITSVGGYFKMIKTHQTVAMYIFLNARQWIKIGKNDINGAVKLLLFLLECCVISQWPRSFHWSSWE